MLESISLFKGIGQRMGFLTTRQRVISQNITQANTPGYAARDVAEPDFKQTMGRYISGKKGPSAPQLDIQATNAGHIGQSGMSGGRAETGDKSRIVYEVAPDKNSIVLEEQVLKASETAMNYQMVTNLYAKHVDMLKLAMRKP